MRNLNNHISKTYKDNPSEETLFPLLVLFSPLIHNLLVIQANLPLNKLSLVSSKALILDKPVNHLLTQINLTSSIPKFLAKLPNQLVSQLSSILNLLGKLSASNTVGPIICPAHSAIWYDRTTFCCTTTTSVSAGRSTSVSAGKPTSVSTKLSFCSDSPTYWTVYWRCSTRHLDPSRTPKSIWFSNAGWS